MNVATKSVVPILYIVLISYFSFPTCFSVYEQDGPRNLETAKGKGLFGETIDAIMICGFTNTWVPRQSDRVKNRRKRRRKRVFENTPRIFSAIVENEVTTSAWLGEYFAGDAVP